MGDKPTVVEALSAVMTAIKAVGKGERNQAQGYNFRGIDAVVNAVSPALRDNGVVVVPVVEDVTYNVVEVGQKRTPMRECTVRVRYVFHGPGGDTIECVTVGEAMDSGDKATPKAMSVAFRVALLQALCLPTDEKDPDADAYERAPRTEYDPVEQEVLVTGWLAEISDAADTEALGRIGKQLQVARRKQPGEDGALSKASYDHCVQAGAKRKAELNGTAA
ncbi:MAG TPA: ERF family protein [Micromonosporaceae bacterium]